MGIEKQPLSETNFAVVDVETTGLGRADRVIEIACVRLRGTELEVDRFESLVNPGIAIAPAASAVSGLTDEMVATAPVFAEIAPELDRLVTDAVFVAHNAPFDLSFLSRERRRYELPAWDGPVLDTLRLARNVVELPGYSLAKLKESLELTHKPSHRAMSDVMATVSLLQALLVRMQPAPTTLGELLHAQEPIPAPWESCHLDKIPAEFVTRLATAAQTGQIVEVLYQGRAGSRSFWFLPLRAEHNGPLFYVRGAMAEHDEERVFRLDRIEDVRIPGQDSHEPSSDAEAGR